MRIVPSLLGWQDPGTAFSAAMQMASLGAVLSYFWKDIQSLVGGTMRSIADGNYQSRDFQLTVGLIIGTLPLGILGLLLKKTLNAPNSPMRGLVVIGVASIVISSLLALSEFQGTRQRGFGKLTLKDGLLVGIAQALALIPGVSRSGSTLTAGLFLGMERETAAKFSLFTGIAHRYLGWRGRVTRAIQSWTRCQWLVCANGRIDFGEYLGFFGYLWAIALSGESEYLDFCVVPISDRLIFDFRLGARFSTLNFQS